MKSFIQKIASLLLIPVLLFSTTTFGISKHMCMGSVYSISYTGDAEECGMEMENHPDDLFKECSFNLNDNCCSTEKASFIGATSDQIQNVQFNVADYSFIAFFIISKYSLFQESTKRLNFHKDYSPPKVTKNRYVLYQVFII